MNDSSSQKSRGRGKILVAHVGERPCRGRSSKVLISRFDPGVKWAQFNCHKSSELHHVAIWSICWSQAKAIFSPDRNRYHEKSQSVNHASCYSPDQSVPCQEFAPGHGANAGPGFEKRAVDPGKIGESWQLNAKVRDFFTFVYRCSWLHMLQIDVPCSALLCASYRLTWIDWGWGSRGMCLIGLKIQRICEAQLLLKTKSWCFKIGQTVFKGILNIYFTRSCDVGYYINLIVYMLHTWSSSNIKEDQGLVMVFVRFFNAHHPFQGSTI